MKELTSKDRSMLAGLASKDKAIFQIGKDGIGDQLIRGLSSALEKRELVKISVLKTAESETDKIAQELSQKLMAQIVKVIGSKIILYRESDKKGVIHLLAPAKSSPKKT